MSSKEEEIALLLTAVLWLATISEAAFVYNKK
jgi:hypothetical protein